jgi:hypothetical protein
MSHLHVEADSGAIFKVNLGVVGRWVVLRERSIRVMSS